MAETDDAAENKAPSRPASPTAPLAAKMPVSSAEAPFTEVEQRIHDMSLSLMDTSKDLLAISTKIDLLDISKHEARFVSSGGASDAGEEKVSPGAGAGGGTDGDNKQPRSPPSQLHSTQQNHDAMLALELSASSDLWRETSAAHDRSFADALRTVKEQQEEQRQAQQRQEQQRQEQQRHQRMRAAGSPSSSLSPSPSQSPSPSPRAPPAPKSPPPPPKSPPSSSTSPSSDDRDDGWLTEGLRDRIRGLDLTRSASTSPTTAGPVSSSSPSSSGGDATKKGGGGGGGP